jgi:hypothetical protein
MWRREISLAPAGNRTSAIQPGAISTELVKRTILKDTLMNFNVTVWTGFSWLRIESSGELL